MRRLLFHGRGGIAEMVTTSSRWLRRARRAQLFTAKNLSFREALLTIQSGQRACSPERVDEEAKYQALLPAPFGSGLEPEIRDIGADPQSRCGHMRVTSSLRRAVFAARSRFCFVKARQLFFLFASFKMTAAWRRS